MRNKLEAALDAVHAEPALKESVARYVAQRTQAPQPHRARRAVLAAACVLVLLLGIGGFSAYFTPTATIQFTINPSVELTVNRFDRVIGATGLNEDGQRLLSSLSLRHRNYLDAIDTILESDTVSRLLAQDKPASIDVSSGDPGRQESMVEAVSSCTAGYQNVRCSGGHGQGGGHHQETTPWQGGHHQEDAAPATPGATPSPTSTSTGGHGHGHRRHHGGG